MTTFDAVTAHWPRKPRNRSTQKSRKSVKTPSATSASTQTKPLTSPVKGEHTSTPHDNITEGPNTYGDTANGRSDGRESVGNAEDEAEVLPDEEENPFETLAMTQRAPDDIIEVDPSFIQRNLAPVAEGEEEEEDDHDRFRKLHEQDAAKHAEESARFRATQVPKRDQEEMSEYDDEELDELFRQTVPGGFMTPRKDRSRGSYSRTPTSVGSSRSYTSRTIRRDQQLRQQAGLGDLRWVLSVH